MSNENNFFFFLYNVGEFDKIRYVILNINCTLIAYQHTIILALK